VRNLFRESVPFLSNIDVFGSVLWTAFSLAARGLLEAEFIGSVLHLTLALFLKRESRAAKD
jgi:hypothetical protein